MQRMAVTHASAPDLVTLTSLHAALDAVLDVEAFMTQASHASPPAAERVAALAAEMRRILSALLRSASAT
jgi:hypothetical protein